MILDTTTRKIQALMSSAVTTTNPTVQVDWVDMTTTTTTPGATPSNLNGVTAVDIVAAPAASTQRKINAIGINNVDTVANTITVRYNDNATLYTLVKVTLQVNETLVWTDTGGWYVLDAGGNVKQSAAGGTGRFVKTTVLTSGTSFTVSPVTNTIFVRLLAGGGAGGGVATAASVSGGAAGGSAGGYAEKTFSVTPNTAYTYAIGGAGSPGAAGANPGGAGGNSTFAVGATTVTANGGPGGLGITAANPVIGMPGAAPAVSTNGDLNGSGAVGATGFTLSATVAVSGKGADSIFGSGGVPKNAQSAGAAGIGFGAGGSGGCLINGGASVAGGVGLSGVIIVYEYT